MMTSCNDDDKAAPGTDRQFMTMFISDYTRGKGSDYPWNTGLDGAYPHGNTIHLYWYGVKDCAGYQIQMALQSKVSGGPDSWLKVQGTSDLLLDTIVGPTQLDMVLKDLQYSTPYRFAIRCLSTEDKNIKGDLSTFEHASNWFGHGNGRQWQEYQEVKTNDRYPTPFAVYVNQAETTEETMHVYLNSNISQLGLTTSDEDQDKLKSFYENFNIDADGNLGYKYMTVTPSPSNPNSTVGEKWKRYEFTPEDLKRGYVIVDGLTANSVYVIDVIDPTVPIMIDAKYNTCTARSDGKPGEPILLKHDEMIAQYNNEVIPNSDIAVKRTDVFAQAEEFNAAPISNVLYDFISNTNYAEGQTFYLEGGKTYYIDGNDVTCKGFVLATDPKDVAEGKRAKVLCGLGKHSDIYTQGTNGEQRQGPFSMFIFGRNPEAGEGGEIYMKKLAFYDIDFDNPTSFNYGDNKAGLGTVAGNYFFNMFSLGMAVTLDSLVISNCTFKRVVRGFIREQGPNYKVWNHVLIENNQFFDCGYYNNGAGGYCWIDGAGTNPGTNLYKDCKVIENTFYDSPFPCFFKEENTTAREAGPWNITFSNNTLVNFNTRANGAIFKMRNLPKNSVYNVKNNLIVLCKQPNDARVLGMWGADIRNTETLADGTAAKVYLNFENNWSTNNDLTNGSIFSGNPWNATSNNFGTLVKNKAAILNGELEVNVASVSATELFVSPCPPYAASSADNQNMHRADALDGTAKEYNVDLHIKHFDNEIVKESVGAARWRP